MNCQITIEVILATYNNAAAMAETLAGYQRQSDPEVRIAIADDGSGPEIKTVVERYAAQGMAIRQVWHPDVGFRRALAMNNAIRTSVSDYLILSDNDCIPHRDFIADHRAWARRGHMVLGRRVDTGPELAAHVLDHSLPATALESSAFILLQAARRGLRHGEAGIRVPLPLARLLSLRPQRALGANMAAWRDDLLAVGGFAERFTSYGGEDVDLEQRLVANGTRPLSMRGHGVLYHLWHPTRSLNP